MVVPYADPSPVRFWQNYFDTGEYLFGRYADSLQLGCDCLGDIHYLDAVIADDLGNPKTIENAICMHEEDYGVLWKHTDLFTGSRETRRQRRMVISFFTTVGNYDYGFYWYLYLDGTIQLEVKATGIAVHLGLRRTASTPTPSRARARRALPPAPVLRAAGHDRRRGAQRRRGGRGRAGADGPGQPVRQRVQPQARTRLAQRVRGAARRRRLGRADLAHHQPRDDQRGSGEPVGYVLLPEDQPDAAGRPDVVDPAGPRSPRKHLWVTAYDPAERYPAGDFVNQHPGGAGLPAWMAADRPIDGEDIVLWHTFGTTHFPRPEDWPVMPVDTSGSPSSRSASSTATPRWTCPHAASTARGDPARRARSVGPSGGDVRPQWGHLLDGHLPLPLGGELPLDRRHVPGPRALGFGRSPARHSLGRCTPERRTLGRRTPERRTLGRRTPERPRPGRRAPRRRPLSCRTPERRPLSCPARPLFGVPPRDGEQADPLPLSCDLAPPRGLTQIQLRAGAHRMAPRVAARVRGRFPQVGLGAVGHVDVRRPRVGLCPLGLLFGVRLSHRRRPREDPRHLLEDVQVDVAVAAADGAVAASPTRRCGARRVREVHRARWPTVLRQYEDEAATRRGAVVDVAACKGWPLCGGEEAHAGIVAGRVVRTAVAER